MQLILPSGTSHDPSHRHPLSCQPQHFPDFTFGQGQLSSYCDAGMSRNSKGLYASSLFSAECKFRRGRHFCWRVPLPFETKEKPLRHLPEAIGSHRFVEIIYFYLTYSEKFILCLKTIRNRFQRQSSQDKLLLIEVQNLYHLNAAATYALKFKPDEFASKRRTWI